MQERISLFLKSSIFFFLLLGCSDFESLNSIDSVHWNKVKERIIENQILTIKDRSLLSSAPHGAAYFIAEALHDQVNDSFLAEIYAFEGEKKSSPWRWDALEEAGFLLRSAGNWQKLRLLLGPHINRDTSKNTLYLYALSLYWDDQRVESLKYWRLLEGHEAGTFFEQEFPLLIGISKWEASERAVVPEEVFRIIETSTDGKIISRLQSYFDQDEFLWSLIPEIHKNFFIVKESVASRHWSKAYFALKEIDLKDSISWDHYIYYVFDIFRKSRHYSQGISWLKELIHAEPHLEGEALFYIGRLYKMRRQWPQSIAALEEAGDKLPDHRKRSAYWYLADTKFSADITTSVDFLNQHSSLWDGTDYFDDILEKIRLESIKKKDVSALLDLWPRINQFGTASMKSAYAYTIGRAVDLDWAKSKDFNWYQEAIAANPWSYFSFMAAYFEGKDRVFMSPGDLVFRGHKESTGFDDPYFKPYLILDNPRQGIGRIRQKNPDLSISFLRSMVDSLQKNKEYSHSISVMNDLLEYKNYELNQEDLKRFFPKAFLEEMNPVISREKLPGHIFYGLVREESRFQSAVQSWAGAIGLSQLMVATAKEEARRMRLSSYDLENPKDNLAIGGHYFRRLIERTGNPSKALMAYNAGLTRLRRWERAHDSYPADLLIDVIPFEETRNYNKKVLVSSVLYGILYFDQKASDVIENFLGF